MRMSYALMLVLLLLNCFATQGQTRQNVAEQKNFAAFWLKFKEAVAMNDKEQIASMTKFPLTMPYGIKNVESKAVFIKSYGKILNAETKKCFAAAEPQFEHSGKKKGYIVSCGEALMYWFEKVGDTYKFTAVDNVNE